MPTFASLCMPGEDGAPRLGPEVPLYGLLLLPLLSLLMGAPAGRRLPPGRPAALPLFSDGRCLSPEEPLPPPPLPPIGAACMHTSRLTWRPTAAGQVRQSKMAFSVRSIMDVNLSGSVNEKPFWFVCFTACSTRQRNARLRCLQMHCTYIQLPAHESSQMSSELVFHLLRCVHTCSCSASHAGVLLKPSYLCMQN